MEEKVHGREKGSYCQVKKPVKMRKKRERTAGKRKRK
jgi:hypothetical protein